MTGLANGLQRTASAHAGRDSWRPAGRGTGDVLLDFPIKTQMLGARHSRETARLGDIERLTSQAGGNHKPSQSSEALYTKRAVAEGFHVRRMNISRERCQRVWDLK